jgi:hypothetical protein
MPRSAFLVPDSGLPDELPLTDFAKELELHSLISQVPALLNECLSEPVVQWLVVRNEMPIPDHADGPDRWAVDVLLLDRSGTTTFVEVKRSRDPRARREVVAQMLDYAANGSSYLDIGNIRQMLQERAEREEGFPAVLQNLTGEDPDEYWRRVRSKLASGQVRLVFVADRIPNELRRLVEFLNEKMPDVQVLALEVRQFKIESRRVVIGEAIGNTMRSQDVKGGQGGGQPRPANLDELFAGQQYQDPGLLENLKKLCDSLEAAGAVPKLAATQFSYSVVTPVGRVQLIGGTRKVIWLPFDSLRRVPALADETARRDLLRSLEDIIGKRIPHPNLQGYPSFEITLLNNDARRDNLTRFFKDLVQKIGGGGPAEVHSHDNVTA